MLGVGGEGVEEDRTPWHISAVFYTVGQSMYSMEIADGQYFEVVWSFIRWISGGLLQLG